MQHNNLILVNGLLGHVYFSVLQGERDGRGNLNNWNSCVPFGLENLALCDGSVEMWCRRGIVGKGVQSSPTPKFPFGFLVDVRVFNCCNRFPDVSGVVCVLLGLEFYQL